MNSKRGGVTLTVDSTEYTLRVSTNAMARFETQTGEPFIGAIEKLSGGSPSVSVIRALVWAALPASDDMTLEAAGDLIDDAGLDIIVGKIGDAVNLAFPSEDGKKSGNGKAAPKAA